MLGNDLSSQFFYNCIQYVLSYMKMVCMSYEWLFWVVLIM